MEITYPSERFPGPPRIRFDLADGWDVADAPPAQITVFDTNSPEHFRVNLMISVKRIATEATIVRVAEQFAEETRSRYPDYDIVGERRTMLNGLEAIVRAQAVTPLGSEYPIFQAELLQFAPDPRPGLRDLVQLHASCPGDMAEHYSPIFKAMIESLTLTAADGTGPDPAVPTAPGVEAF